MYLFRLSIFRRIEEASKQQPSAPKYPYVCARRAYARKVECAHWRMIPCLTSLDGNRSYLASYEVHISSNLSLEHDVLFPLAGEMSWVVLG